MCIYIYVCINYITHRRLQDKMKNKRTENAAKEIEERKANERIRRVKGREMADAKAKLVIYLVKYELKLVKWPMLKPS